MLYPQSFLALLTLTAVTKAQSPFKFGTPADIFNTPGPVIPEVGPDFPFDRLSNNSENVATTIRQEKLSGFCNELMSGDDNNEQDVDSDRQTHKVHSSYSSSVNYNSNTGSGHSYSSSYSNNNGRISGSVSGYGPSGQGYSYKYGENSDSDRVPTGTSSYSSTYTIDGIEVPDALREYTPKAIKKGCTLALKGHRNSSRSPQRLPNPTVDMGNAPPKVFFENVYYGSGTDLLISSLQQPGLPKTPYFHGEFVHYRQACGQACVRNTQCRAFVVCTDFKTNACGLVINKNVSRGDFIDQVEAGDGRYHVEGYNKKDL